MPYLDLVGLTLDEAKEKVKVLEGDYTVEVSETRSRSAEVTGESPLYVIRQKIDGTSIHLVVAYF